MGWVPTEACTLPTLEQPLRVAEFDDLFALHLVSVDRIDAGRVEMRLSAGDEVRAKAQSLADRETSCCSFFSFDVTTDEQGVRMLIEVPSSRSDVLEALAVRAERAR